VILFSDILTPLPAVGVPFEIDDNKGPLIDDPIRSMEQVGRGAAAGGAPAGGPPAAAAAAAAAAPARLLRRPEAPPTCPCRPCPPSRPPAPRPPKKQLSKMHALDLSKLSFVGEALSALRAEVGPAAAVLGFVGSPWTLATYLVEVRGGGVMFHVSCFMPVFVGRKALNAAAPARCARSRAPLCCIPPTRLTPTPTPQGASSSLYKTIKSMAHSNPALLDGMLSRLADAMAEYMCYQIEAGAQVGPLGVRVGGRHSGGVLCSAGELQGGGGIGRLPC
jgi:hypothetical protein